MSIAPDPGSDPGSDPVPDPESAEVEIVPACTCGEIDGVPYAEAFGAHGLNCPAEDVPVRAVDETP